MISEPVILIVVIFMALMLAPLVVYFPWHVGRFFRARRAWKRRGSGFKPSVGLVVVYVWFMWTIPAAPVVFLHYARRGHPPQAEARVNLESIWTSQNAYFGEHNKFASGPDAFAQIGWGPEGNTRFTYFTGRDRIESSDPARRLPYSPEGEWPFAVRPESTSTGFTAMAIGNIDRDEALDVWTINDAKELRNVVNDVAIGPSFPFPLWPWIKITLINVVWPAMQVLALLSPAWVVLAPMLFVRVVQERRKWKEFVRRRLVRQGMDVDERG